MLRPGDVIADRFEIEALADSGGMGAVYRARDRQTGAAVAIKVLLCAPSGDDPRFAHEARVLAEVAHPAIVRYVAHGKTPGGEQYLAMEWLEGEDLGQRIAHAGLTVADSVALARRVAEGLASMHDRGIVHRDLKPSNIFLDQRRIEHAKIVDFGLAHRATTSRAMTRTGTALGTPGYMAPEQARGDRDIDARADLFSLGCVLFECLTGRPAFAADHPMGILAKILFEDAARVTSLRPDVPLALEALVARMLRKHRDERPASAAALAEELAALGPLPTERRAEAAELPSAITHHELRLVSMVLAARATRTIPETASIDSDAATLSIEVSAPDLAALRDAVVTHRGRVEVLADGSVVAMLSGSGAATDLAVRAARCALALRAVLPDSPMALATGRGEVSSRLPVGDAIDRGVRMLRVESAPALSASDARVRPIRLDPVTAGLIDARFEVAGDERGLVLLGERDHVSGARKLLGKPTPCVGRDRELRLLQDLFDECAGDRVARAVLVTGPAGMGKSRVRHEHLQWLAGRDAPPAVWMAHGDAMHAGSAFGILGQLVRHAAQIRDGEPLAVRQQKLRARVARHLAADRVTFVAELVGELSGIPFSAEESAILRAGRQDALVMGEQMRLAWEEWLAAECATDPLVLVLEDLHWGDLPSVKFLDSSLRKLAAKPLMVLALARPEVNDQFPRLWAERDVHEVRLVGLTRRASNDLVGKVLGDADPAVVARIVERAGGNAFFLEELIRAVAAGQGDSFPDTVVAMTQVRLESMDADARQTLRAASVLGRRFWKGSLVALLGGDAGAGDLATRLADLSARELIEPQSSRFPGEEEYAFRHALVREAAYAMLTDADRALGHRVAGGWLAAAGEGDALVLAEHFELGGELALAAAGYRRAAEQAFEGSDLAAVMQRVERGLACGAEGEVRGALRLLQAEVHVWRGDPPDRAAACTTDALAMLPHGGALWCKAAAGHLLVNVQLGNLGALFMLVADLRGMSPAPAARGGYVQAVSILVTFFVNLALYDLMEPFVQRLLAVGGPHEASEPLIRGWMNLALLHWKGFVQGDQEAQLRHARASLDGFDQGGDLRARSLAFMQCGYASMLLGDHASAAASIEEGRAEAVRIGASYVALRALVYRAELRLRTGDLEGARDDAASTAASFAKANLRTLEGTSRRLLARTLLALGRLEEAEREGRAAADLLMVAAFHHPEALAITAQIVLASGRPAEALGLAEQAMKQLTAMGRLGIHEGFVRGVHVAALLANGDADGARAAARVAKAKLDERAAGIVDPHLRATYAASIADDLRALGLAAAG